MCGSCVQPAVSSILKRSIKKQLMVVLGMTAQRGEQGPVNRRAETYIAGNRSVRVKRGGEETYCHKP